MKIAEIREKSIEDLQAMSDKLASEYTELKIKQITGDYKKSHEFQNIRRNIARLNTVLSEKKLYKGTKDE